MCVVCSDQSAIVGASDVSSPLFGESHHQQSCSDSAQSTSQIGNVESSNTDHESPSSTVDEQRPDHRNGSGKL